MMNKEIAALALPPLVQRFRLGLEADCEVGEDLVLPDGGVRGVLWADLAANDTDEENDAVVLAGCAAATPAAKGDAYADDEMCQVPIPLIGTPMVLSTWLSRGLGWG